ncbi:MAG TPA: hypothetical protein VGJ20_12985 [Xanthobacteraceae bacterium]|jgi:hypothetical protein
MDGIRITIGSTYDNADHLSPAFLKNVRELYQGTRLGRQELHGTGNAVVLVDVDNLPTGAFGNLPRFALLVGDRLLEPSPQSQVLDFMSSTLAAFEGGF